MKRNEEKQILKKKVGDYIFKFQDLIHFTKENLIYLGFNEKNKEEVAIKCYELKLIKKYQCKLEKLQTEIRLLENLKYCKNIVKLKDIYSSENHTYIVTQFCSNMDLKRLLEKGKKLSWDKIKAIMKDIANGLSELHNKGIIHRNIQPSNILITKSKAKIADFSKATQLKSNSKFLFEGGDQKYMAPQSIKFNIYNKQSDVWSYGVVFYQVLFQMLPFSKNELRQFNQVANEKSLQFPPSKCPIDLKKLIQTCLQFQPQKRIRSQQIYEYLCGNYKIDQRVIKEPIYDQLRDNSKKYYQTNEIILKSNVYYCQFLNRIQNQIDLSDKDKSTLLFFILKNMLILLNKLYVAMINPDLNPFQLQNWTLENRHPNKIFLNSNMEMFDVVQKFEDIRDLIFSYCLKTIPIIEEKIKKIRQICNHERFLPFFNDNYQQSEGLICVNLQVTKRVLRKYQQQLKQFIGKSQYIQNDTKIIFLCQYLLIFYKINIKKVDFFQDKQIYVNAKIGQILRIQLYPDELTVQMLIKEIKKYLQ